MFKKLYIIILVFINIEISASDFGTTGIIDIPSARMLSDGTLQAKLSYQKIANITNITYQATPWLQTTFRYTIFNPDNPNRNSSGVDGVNDRSYSAKITLLNESKYKPQVAIGVKDILGTGVWGSEYIVSSKKINNLDVTLGLGWGRLSNNNTIKNPMINFGDSFRDRNKSSNQIGGQFGGQVRTNSFFKGPQVGIFGGISYKIPNSNISFLAEYNTDSYIREINEGTISSSSAFSYGMKWTKLDSFNIGLSYQQGNQLGLSISSKFNTKTQLSKPIIEPFYSASDGYDLSAAPKSLDLNSWYDRLFFDLERSGILLRSAKLISENNQVQMEITNFQYNSTADAINRVLTLSQIHLPKNIRNIDIILNEANYKVITIAYDRQNSSNRKPTNQIKLLEGREIKNPTNVTKFLTPLVKFDINLATRFQLFDPDKPMKHQVFLKTNATVSLTNNWNIFGSFAVDIDNNFDLNRGPNSVLPHVRTDINRYLVEGSSGIESLYLEKRANISNNLYYRAYFGVLETMYSGFGAEVLYQPFNSRLGLGGTINKVKKRGYKRNFELLDYNVVTGFISLFYASPFYNYDIALHVGKYLAKDRGATLELRRTFDNGFAVGAFATLTNVSAADYGEGSFDKGLFFRIPFSAFTRNNTKTGLSTIIRSIQRDGGQKIDDFTGRLWHDFRNVRYDNINNNKDRMLPR